MISALRQWMRQNRIHWLTAVVHVGVAAWAVIHVILFYVEDPVDTVDWLTAVTGRTGINLLLLSLACTPLVTLTGWFPFARVRRPLGVYGFAWVAVHFVIYIVLFHDFYWEDIVSDILNRNIYRVGFAAFALMVPMAITSTRGWQRRLKRNWSRLHKFMYPVCFLAALHFIWVDKRPNMWELLTAGQVSDIAGQLATGSYLRMELILLLLLLRVPAIRQPIVQARNQRKRRKTASSARNPRAN